MKHYEGYIAKLCTRTLKDDAGNTYSYAVSYTHLDVYKRQDVDELNFLAARLEQLDPAEVGKLNAALQQKNGLANIGQVIDFTYNEMCIRDRLWKPSYKIC